MIPWPVYYILNVHKQPRELESVSLSVEAVKKRPDSKVAVPFFFSCLAAKGTSGQSVWESQLQEHQTGLSSA